MKKYGWDWTSEKAADAYRLILIKSGCYPGSLAGSEDLTLFIDLADEVVRLEGRIPDSFKVAVDLGSIYSAAAVSNARDARAIDEFIAKANAAWCIASSHLEKGVPKDAALLEPGPLRAAYVGGYWQIPCEIGFARYIQTDSTAVSHLRALRKFWERAKQERPNHPVLLAVGEQIDQKLGIEQSEPKPRQGLGALMVAAVIALTMTLAAGVAYVYREMGGPQPSQQRLATGPARSASDREISVPSETTTAAPSSQREAMAPVDPGHRESSKQHQQGEERLREKSVRQAGPPRKTQRGISGTALGKPPLSAMQSDIDSSEQAFQESPQPVASSAISPPQATSPRKTEECAPGLAGIICRERKRWDRCSGRWGTPGCEIYQGQTLSD